MRALSLLGFLLSLVCAGVGLASMGGVGIAALFGGVLVWAWSNRDRHPDVQGRTTIACALGVALVGFAGGNLEAARELALTDQGAAQLLGAVSLAMIVSGLALCVYACRTLAIAKGRTGLLAVLGILHVAGYTVVLLLPARTPAGAASAEPDLGTPPVL